jgi:hypothetical protein
VPPRYLDQVLKRVLCVAATATLAFAAPAAAQDRAAERRAAAVDALERVEALTQGRGVRTGRELTPALLELARRRPALSRAQRARAAGFFARPTDPLDQGPTGSYKVAEAPPYCASANFCIHYVTSTTDAPPLTDANSNAVPDYVEFMRTAFDESFMVENTQLGWLEPKSDGTLGGGGSGKTDVYIKDIGDENIFGYATTDPNQSTRSQYGYLVMDDDYSMEEFGYSSFQEPLRVTAAHEYNHVLQFGYDIAQDTWMFESTATWAEEKVFDAIDDYLFYLAPWARLPHEPLTSSGDGAPPTDDDLKMYGSAVWNHWLEGRYGADVVRRAWDVSDFPEESVDGGGFAPGAYDRAITDKGGRGFADEFQEMSAATAEWDAVDSGIREGAKFSLEVTRRGTLTVNGAPAAGLLDHTGFALYHVPVPDTLTLRLTGGLPAGVPGSIALVGTDGGDMTKVVGALDSDGRVTVTLPDPGRMDRITAVVTNADTSQTGLWGPTDWMWTRDAQPFSLAVSDAVGPEPTPTPTPSPTPTPTVTPPPPPIATTLLLRTGTLARMATLARRGYVPVKAEVSKAGRLLTKATVDRATAKRLRIGRRVRKVGSSTRTATSAGTVQMKVRLTRKARAGLKRQRRTLRMTVRTAFTAAEGGSAVTRKLSLLLRP